MYTVVLQPGPVGEVSEELSNIAKENVNTSLTEDSDETSTPTTLTRREDHDDSMDAEQVPPRNNSEKIISDDHENENAQGKDDNDTGGQNISQKDAERDFKQGSDEGLQNHSVTKSGTTPTIQTT